MVVTSSMSRPGAFRLSAGSPFSLSRCRVRLSSMLRIASHNSLTTAASLRALTTVFDDLAQLVVQRLDAVGGVDDPAQHRREGQEGHEPVPGVGEGLDGRGVALTQLAAVKGRPGPP